MSPLQLYWRIKAIFQGYVFVHNFRLTCCHIHYFMSLLAIIVLVDVVVLIDNFDSIKLHWVVFPYRVDWLIEFSVLLLRHLKRSWVVLLKGHSLLLEGSCGQRTLPSVDLEVGYRHSACTLDFILRNVMLGADRLLNSYLLELGVWRNVLVRRGVTIIRELRGGGRNFLKVLALCRLSQAARSEEVNLVLGRGRPCDVVSTFVHFMHLNVGARLAVLKSLRTPQQILTDSELRNFWKFGVMSCNWLY